MSFKFAVPFGGRISKSGFKDDFDGILTKYAGVAQLVEHHLAKVRVASSSLVSRSEKKSVRVALHFFCLVLDLRSCLGSYPGGGIGRHAGLKILWLVIAVRVQLPSGVLFAEH